MKLKRKRKNRIKIIFQQDRSIPESEVQRRLEKAYDVLFGSLKQPEEQANNSYQDAVKDLE